MRPIQWYLKCCWNHVAHGLRHPILVTRDLVQVLQWGLIREHLSHGMHFMLPSATITITTDVNHLEQEIFSRQC